MTARRESQGVAVLFAAALGWTISPALSSAQSVVTPGAVRQSIAPSSAPTTAPLQPDLELPDAAPPVPEGGPGIAVHSFRIAGNAALADAELQGAIADSVGKKLTLFEIYAVADKLAAYYRAKGYTLATVTIPAQEVTTGVVELEVVEGRIGRVRFEGNALYNSGFLSRQVDEIQVGEALTGDGLEHELLLLNDLPGLQARAVIRPGEAYGSSDVVIRTTEQPFETRFEFDNYGRESIGEWRLGGFFTVNNVTGRGDRLTLDLLGAQASRLLFGGLGYDVPVNTAGTRIRASVSRFRYTVDTTAIGFPGFDLEGEGNDYRLEVSHPWQRGRDRNLTVFGGFSRSDSTQSGTLVVGSGSDFMNLLDVGFSYSRLDAGSMATTVDLRFSTNFQSNKAATDSHAQQGKFTANVTHFRPISADWSLIAKGSGVWSIDPLGDLERFRIGGTGSVRAFPSAEVAGDDGFFASLQVQRPLAPFDATRLTWRVYADLGVVYRQAESRRLSGAKASESLAGFGTGLRMNFLNAYSLSVDGVLPTGHRNVSDGRDSARIWASLTAAF